jgi:hypothetical protein
VASFAIELENNLPVKDLMTHLGTPYDYANIIALAWVQIAANWFSLKLRSWVWSTRAQKCSELVFLFLRKVGIDTNLGKESFTPEDALKLVEASKRFERV